MFLERLFNGTRCISGFLANDKIEQDGVRVGTGGVMVVSSRSLVIELDVCVVYNGK